MTEVTIQKLLKNSYRSKSTLLLFYRFSRKPSLTGSCGMKPPTSTMTTLSTFSGNVPAYC